MTRMTPSEAFVETMVAHGVKHIFGIVGSAYMDALDIFEPAGIRFISVAHEQGAAHMAAGFPTNRASASPRTAPASPISSPPWPQPIGLIRRSS
jgi:thiamine pyrophosphate-dependent acetolactate synthase large subunit-like protein